MAAAAGCPRPSSTCLDYYALTSEEPADGGSLTATSAAGGQSSGVAIGSAADDSTPAVRFIGCLVGDEHHGTDDEPTGMGGSTNTIVHPRAAVAASASATTGATSSTSCISSSTIYAVRAGRGTVATHRATSCCISGC